MKEIRLISCGLIGHVSDIKLIRTDTTLDLSQKAEKGMNFFLPPALLLIGRTPKCLSMWDIYTPHLQKC